MTHGEFSQREDDRVQDEIGEGASVKYGSEGAESGVRRMRYL